jgi:redox-sensitive bicupin YhaK (pirin superfamily)
MNASTTADVHLVQMWVPPDTLGIEPSYEQRDMGDALASGGLVVIASGREGDDAITLHQRDAAFAVARLAAGEEVALPGASHAHLFVAVGDATLAGTGALDTGDAARCTAAGELVVTAGDDGAELLYWTTA